MATPYKIYGAIASPYSVKIRALMRYRRLPHIWIDGNAARAAALADVKVPVIPVVEFPDGSRHNDSTPLIRKLEERHASRSVVPIHDGNAFLAALIEDFADEWLTKAMFLYRWRAEVDQEVVSRWLVFDGLKRAGPDLGAKAAAFKARQTGRLEMVSGTGSGSAALVKASTHAVLSALEAHLTDGFFLFGSRPSAAEFAVFGQLAQLASDPTPMAMMRERYPHTNRWLDHVSDLSGVEGEWSDGITKGTRALLSVIGKVYLPFLAANAAAVEAGGEEVAFSAMGHDYRQAPFGYQTKCLASLRSQYHALDEQAARDIRDILSDTDCLTYFEGK
ncbi:MAG: glutathione S-transferase family protein [Pacificimonas sp.]